MTKATLRRFVQNHREIRSRIGAVVASILNTSKVYCIGGVTVSREGGSFVVWKAGKRFPVIICSRTTLAAAKSEAERYAG